MTDNNILNMMTKAAIAFADDLDEELPCEETPVDYESMSDSDREAHLVSYQKDQIRFRQEYEKCYDCRIIQVPRRKEESGFFSFMSYSTLSLVDGDGNNFISDLREAEEENLDRKTPLNLHIFVDTHGGRLSTAETICKAMLQYPGTIKVFVANQAMSAGTMIALSGHEIYLRAHAHLGQIDPQIGSYWAWVPANSIEAANKKLEEFETPWVRDLLRAGMGPAQDSNSRVSDLIDRIVEVRKWSESFKDNLCSNLLSNFLTGGYGHDRPYDYCDLQKFWNDKEDTESPTTSSNPLLHADWPKSVKILMREPAEKPKASKPSYMSALGL
jgi:Serine dehydrogenase proteinase